MSDVATRIISANVYRHGRATVAAFPNGSFYANGHSGIGVRSPINASGLEVILTDRFSSQDGSSDAIISFDTRSFAISTSILPLTGVVEGSKVQIKAADSNTGIVYVGPPGVTANTNTETDGFPLSASQATYLPVVQTGVIHFIADSPNNKVFILEI